MISRIFNSLSGTRSGSRTSKWIEPNDPKTSSINDFKTMAAENRNRRASAPEILPNSARAPVKRRSSIFGISSVSCDDYVQKDLTSSSWC